MIKKHSITVNAALNGFRQCLAILIPLVSFPYISRKLGSEGYGIYSFSWSITSYFVMLAGLGINTYAVREGSKIRNNSTQLELFSTQLFTINLVSCLVSICLLMTLVILTPRLRTYYQFFAIESLAILLSALGRDWINGINEDYLYITLNYALTHIITTIFIFLFVKGKKDTFIFCFLMIIGSYGGNLFNVIHTQKTIKLSITKNLDIKEHIRPLVILFTTQMAISLYLNSDITMLGFYYDDETVGIYSFSSKIYGMIKQLINALTIVTLPKMSIRAENKLIGYTEAIKKLSSYLTLITIPTIAFLLILGENMIIVAGGVQFIEGIHSLRILALAIIPAVFGAMLMNSVIIPNRMDMKGLLATIISASINLLLNLIFLPKLKLIGAASTTLIAEISNTILLLYFSNKIIKINNFDIKNLFDSLISTCSILVVLFIVKRFSLNSLITIIVSGVLSVSVYLMSLVCLRNKIALEIFKQVRQLR